MYYDARSTKQRSLNIHFHSYYFIRLLIVKGDVSNLDMYNSFKSLKNDTFRVAICNGNGTCFVYFGGTQWRCWLGCCSRSRMVVGSIPEGVIGIFH
jgi:hypothetical protein